MTVAEGTMVTQSVRLVRQLGQGGMGSVWMASHLGLDTEVAVKFISAELVKEQPSVVTRFKREAAAAAKIRSPHVVQVFDHGLMDDGTPFIVMELLQGESLASRLARLSRVGLEEAIVVVAQVAKALTDAHALGIVHRDIKPDNIFLTASAGELFAKVLDFGIAKQTSLPGYDQLTGTKMLVGTPEYMSPEQIVSARQVDGRSDLWAMAVVAYQMVTGRMPFAGETVGGLIIAISNSAFVPTSSLGMQLPPNLDAWFARAFARNIEQRFSSAKELADAFRSCIVGNAASSGEWRQALPSGTQIAPYSGPGSGPGPAPSSPTVFAAPAGATQPNTFSGAASTRRWTRNDNDRRWLIVGGAAAGLVTLSAVAFLATSNGSADEQDTTASSAASQPSATSVASDRANDDAPTAEASSKDAEPAPSSSSETDDEEADEKDDSLDTTASADKPPASKPPKKRRPRGRKKRLGF